MKLGVGLCTVLFIASCEVIEPSDYRDDFTGTYQGTLFYGDSHINFTDTVDWSESYSGSRVTEIHVTKGNEARLLALTFMLDTMGFPENPHPRSDTIEIYENGVFEGDFYQYYRWYNVVFKQDSLLIDNYESGVSYSYSKSYRCIKIYE